jgi:hypothetical protein
MPVPEHFPAPAPLQTLQDWCRYVMVRRLPVNRHAGRSLAYPPGKAASIDRDTSSTPAMPSTLLSAPLLR